MHFNRGYGSIEYREQPELFTIRFSGEPEYNAPPLAQIRSRVDPIPTAGATAVDINLTLAEHTDGSFTYGINGVPFAADRPLHASAGETQVWTITNSTDWSHPFHLHGFRFLVIDEQGQPVRPMAWKDTVDVPLRETVRFVVRFDDRPGTWMYHCHILDHADGGMMGVLQVGTADDVGHVEATHRH